MGFNHVFYCYGLGVATYLTIQIRSFLFSVHCLNGLFGGGRQDIKDKNDIKKKYSIKLIKAVSVAKSVLKYFFLIL